MLAFVDVASTYCQKIPEEDTRVFAIDRIAHRSFLLNMLESFLPQDFDGLLPMRMKVHPGVKHFWRQLYVVLQTNRPSITFP
jgi:hypothetical protein